MPLYLLLAGFWLVIKCVSDIALHLHLFLDIPMPCHSAPSTDWWIRLLATWASITFGLTKQFLIIGYLCMHAWYFPRTKSVSMRLTLTFIHEICLRKRVKCAPAFRVFWGKKRMRSLPLRSLQREDGSGKNGCWDRRGGRLGSSFSAPGGRRGWTGTLEYTKIHKYATGH